MFTDSIIVKKIISRMPVSLRNRIKTDLVRLRMPFSNRGLRPSFFLIGGMKCGTTSLFNNLALHPNVAAPVSKEIRYFDFFYHRQKEWYNAHFPMKIMLKLKHGEDFEAFQTGEASPSYLFNPHTPARVKDYNSDARIIVMLRNPVDRALSHYNHTARYTNEPLSFEEAVNTEESRIGHEMKRHLEDPKFLGDNRILYSYLARGHYLEQLTPWFDTFSKENILVIKSEDYFEDTHKIYSDVLEFLGLPHWTRNSFAKLNTARYSPLSEELKDQLYAYFEPYNQQLYKYLGHSFNWEKDK